MKRNLALLLMLIMAVQAFPQEKKPLTIDDLVTWISPNILYNRLIAAGRLP